MLTKTALRAIRRRLEDERKQIQQQIADQERSAAGDGEWNPDRTDLADEYSARDRRVALLSVERSTLAQIEDALRRLDAGTYGVCQKCGGPIGEERLEVLPYATLCITCQRANSEPRA